MNLFTNFLVWVFLYSIAMNLMVKIFLTTNKCQFSDGEILYTRQYFSPDLPFTFGWWVTLAKWMSHTDQVTIRDQAAACTVHYSCCFLILAWMFGLIVLFYQIHSAHSLQSFYLNCSHHQKTTVLNSPFSDLYIFIFIRSLCIWLFLSLSSKIYNPALNHW